MKKTIMTIAAVVLFVVAFVLLTGAEKNPVQLVVAIPMLGVVAWLTNVAMPAKKVEHRHKVYNYRKGTLEAA